MAFGPDLNFKFITLAACSMGFVSGNGLSSGRLLDSGGHRSLSEM
jgi:hypothetical protein